MNKIITVLLMISIGIVSCKKESSAPVTKPAEYMIFSPSSSWNYETIDNATASTLNYTVISTNKDTLANGKTYHVFTSSTGNNEYYNVTGHEYFSFQNLPTQLGGTAVQNLYLKDNIAINNSWTQTYNVTISGLPITVNLTNTVTEKGISKIINAINYSEVIHISTAISISVLGMPVPTNALTTDIQSYYAKNYGMIQSKNKINLNYNGIVNNTDQITKLKIAVIK